MLRTSPDGRLTRRAGPIHRFDLAFLDPLDEIVLLNLGRGGELYNLATDPTQEKNRYATETAKVKELAALMERYVAEGRSTPGLKQKNDVDVVWDKRGK